MDVAFFSIDIYALWARKILNSQKQSMYEIIIKTDKKIIMGVPMRKTGGLLLYPVSGDSAPPNKIILHKCKK